MRDGAVDLILLQKQLILPPRPALPGVRLQRFTLFISVYTPPRQSRFDPYLNKNLSGLTKPARLYHPPVIPYSLYLCLPPLCYAFQPLV